MPQNTSSTHTTTIFTIGHSTLPIDEFIAILKAHGVKSIVDVRTIPGSRHNPQFNKEALPLSLENASIGYTHAKELGGLRRAAKDSVNMAWRNASFRGYADYMQTAEFADAIDELIRTSKTEPTVIMCAEAVPWRCHRSLIGDALLARGIAVEDIMNEKTRQPHKLTGFANIKGSTITYPGDE